MIIQKARLTNYRNFKSKLISFSPETTVIVGSNASGKTNILEALHLLSAGKSFHARIEEEMIAYRAQLSRVKGRILIDGDKTDLEIILTRGEITVGEEPEKTQKTPRKKLLVNGVPRRLYNFAGNYKVVLFGPWDLELVTESPSVRRRFLDVVLSQVDGEYRRAILSYEKGLRQRNKLLYRIREDPSTSSGHVGATRSQLIFWDRLLIKNGDYITRTRSEFISYANNTPVLDDQDFSLNYDKSIISEKRLEQYAKEEVAAASTLVGPHRDDFAFKLKERKRERARDLARYGSRGEQRMGVLWLKLAELSFIEDKTDEKPTLLLDDIFSELDHEHRDVVMKFVGNQQTIITTADPHFIKGLKKVEKIHL